MRAVFPVFRLAGENGYEIGLVGDRQYCLTHPHIVERRLQVIEAQAADPTQGIGPGEHQIGIGLENGVKFEWPVLPPIGLAGSQCRGFGHRIGDI